MPRSMATSGKGTGIVGYNVQIAVDAEHRHCHINRFYCSLLASPLDSDSINSMT
jgi:hypothetical protein